MASEQHARRMRVQHLLQPSPDTETDISTTPSLSADDQPLLPARLAALRLDESAATSPSEDEALAVDALDTLRSYPGHVKCPASTSTPTPTPTSTQHRPTSHYAHSSHSPVSPASDPALGAHPLVRGTLDAYARAKQKSRFVKYGAGLVESLGRPVISRVGGVLGEDNIQHLDGFARRQLDWLVPSKQPTEAPLTGPSGKELDAALASVLSPTEREAITCTLDEQTRRAWGSLSPEELAYQVRQVWLYVLHARWPDLAGPAPQTAPGSASASASPASGLQGSEARLMQPLPRRASTAGATDGLAETSQEAQQHEPRGALTSLLVGAGASAGGLSGAIAARPGSIKSLKYCLQWLQYSTAHLEHHITSLRDVMVQINHGERDMASLAPPVAANLAQIKGDVVRTIRSVVGVVSTYAGAALPTPARNTVKGFLLALPARWTSLNNTAPPAPQSSEDAQRAAIAAHRVFVLAVESLDILRNVTVVFGESLDKVDVWVNRLCAAGIQRKRALVEDQDRAGPDEPLQLRRASGASVGASPDAAELDARARSPGALSAQSVESGASSKRRRTRMAISPGEPLSYSQSVQVHDDSARRRRRGSRMGGTPSTPGPSGLPAAQAGPSTSP